MISNIFVRNISLNIGGHKTTTLVKQDTIDDPNRIDYLLPTNKSRKAAVMPSDERARRLAMMPQELKNLQPIGLRPIKQVELWKK